MRNRSAIAHWRRLCNTRSSSTDQVSAPCHDPAAVGRPCVICLVGVYPPQGYGSTALGLNGRAW
eukprot:13626154-Heterocapsa_arctica.AAC.1